MGPWESVPGAKQKGRGRAGEWAGSGAHAGFVRVVKPRGSRLRAISHRVYPPLPWTLTLFARGARSI
jgi:hypothetical protein